jgi:ATP-dependent RNA helicase SUPV3L1/SUV3
VTIPYIAEVPTSAYTLSGYRPAGSRAIRIDMLERLADILRTQDTKGGFEAVADMLSITGMTLEQFADLMQGLGYKAEKGEREKSRPAAEPKAPVEGGENPIPEEASPIAEAEAEAAETAPETEVFYTFTWAPRPRAPRHDRGPRREGGNREGGNREGGEKRQGGKPEFRRDREKGDGERKFDKPKGKKPHGKPRDEEKARHFEARPPKKDKPIDPDNPFAVLAALRDRK